MRPFEIICSVSFLLALFAGLRRFDKLEKERATLSTRCSELEAKLKQAEDTLKSVRLYYEEKAERKEKQIEGLRRALQTASATRVAAESTDDQTPGAHAG